MSTYIADRIYKPRHFRLRSLSQGRGKRKPYVIGFDSEAHSCQLSKHSRCKENGKPFLFQFGHPDGHVDLVDVRDQKPHDALNTFMSYVWDHTTRKDTEYIIFGFNLQYEFTQLFRDLGEAGKMPEFILGYKDEPDGANLIFGDEDKPYFLRVLNDKRYTMTIEFPNRKRYVRVLDAFAFLPTSLENAARMLGYEGKAPRPDTFDRSAAHDGAFVAYAEQDARLTQRLGDWVVSIHEEYDITQSISAPHFACKVYRRVFLDNEIPLPEPALEQAGLWAYHGGKNGYYRAKPVILKGVYHVDIKSAYPEAMHQLPDPERSTWIWHDSYSPGLHAIWHVKGRYKRCKYRGLMDDASWPRSGRVDLHTTGYELDQAIAQGEMEMTSCEGWSLEGPSGGSLVEFVERFYAMKRDAKDPGTRTVAKLLLNSLYGKFFQKQPNFGIGAWDIETGTLITTDPTQAYDHTAGGLYHPPIAALITGYVRAKIHGLEHRYDSIMTSTDGFFSIKPVDDRMIGSELGDLSQERGKLRIWRERLYVFDPEDGSDPVYAMHGYQGKLASLRRLPMMAGNIHHYDALQMVTLKQAGKRLSGVIYQAGEFAIVRRSVTMPGTPAPKPP